MFFYNLFNQIAIATKYSSKKHISLEKKRKEFSSAMKYYDFVNIIDKIKLKYKLKEVYILGSDYWENTTEALLYLQEKNIKPIVTTNGLFCMLKNKDILFKYNLNLYSFFQYPDLQRRILTNIGVFVNSSEDSKLELFLPYWFASDNKKFLKLAKDMAKYYSLKFFIDTDDQLKFKNNKKLPLFHPDGKSVSWGVQYNKKYILKDYLDLYDLEKDMLKHKKEIIIKN